MSRLSRPFPSPEPLGRSQPVKEEEAASPRRPLALGRKRPVSQALILQPILKPAVNDWPLAASRTKIEKVRPVCLQVSKEEKATHHAGVDGIFLRPVIVFAKDRLSGFVF